MRATTCERQVVSQPAASQPRQDVSPLTHTHTVRQEIEKPNSGEIVTRVTVDMDMLEVLVEWTLLKVTALKTTLVSLVELKL